MVARHTTHGDVATCGALTRTGRPCRRRAGPGGYCQQHDAAAFYARALAPDERAVYAEALEQEGLAGEVAVLRLHLLRLLGRDDPERPAEIPRTVHALVRALKDGRAGDADGLQMLDALLREEGRRWLEGEPGDTSERQE